MDRETRDKLEMLCALDPNLRFNEQRYSVDICTEISTCHTFKFEESYTERLSVSPYQYAFDPEGTFAEMIDALFNVITAFVELHGFVIYHNKFYDYVEGRWVEITKFEAVNRWLDSQKDVS